MGSAPDLALHADPASVTGDDFLGGWKSESRSTWFRAIKRFEHPCRGSIIHAAAGIDDFNDCLSGFLEGVQGDRAGWGGGFQRILQQMTDGAEAIDFYATALDLTWLPDPYSINVRQVQLLSADRDIMVDDIPGLVEKYDAIAADWESGAIAWVAARNGIRCLILRGVSDIVGVHGGEAYGNSPVFEAGTRVVMRALLDSLPSWLINLP